MKGNLTFTKIKEEAERIRKLIEACDKKNTELLADYFPVMSCKVASMLLSFHFLKLWPKTEIYGVTGAAEKGRISHYWIEIGELAIDITGDQYNVLNCKELNKAIVRNRPFSSVHVDNKNNSYLYELFIIVDREILTNGFPTIGEDFIESIEFEYHKLFKRRARI